MELYLLRHGVAVDRGTPGFEDDRRRPLTPEGRRRMRRAAQGMKALELSFDWILSSPYPRARQTAELVAGVFKLGRRLKFSDHLAAGAPAGPLVRELARKFRPGARLLLVGHEPDLSRLAARLMGGPRTLGLKLKKGALAKLTLGTLRFGACAELEWLVTSRQLTLLA